MVLQVTIKDFMDIRSDSVFVVFSMFILNFVISADLLCTAFHALCVWDKADSQNVDQNVNKHPTVQGKDTDNGGSNTANEVRI